MANVNWSVASRIRPLQLGYLIHFRASLSLSLFHVVEEHKLNCATQSNTCLFFQPSPLKAGGPNGREDRRLWHPRVERREEELRCWKYVRSGKASKRYSNFSSTQIDGKIGWRVTFCFSNYIYIFIACFNHPFFIKPYLIRTNLIDLYSHQFRVLSNIILFFIKK